MWHHASIRFGLALFTLVSISARAGLPEFTGLVATNSPAVVNISTRQTVHASDLRSLPELGQPGESEFNDFLRKFFEQHKDQMPPGIHGGPDLLDDQNERSLGSGFVISPDGYILTNRHVVKDADEVIVRFADRREYEAEVIGADNRSDVALLKIDAQGLPTLVLGDSTSLQVGEWVLAIGSPFGFDHSATAGIVSAKRRSLPSEQYVPFIQTDVAINPGNSGGPLFNLKGEVVGINSQIYSRTGGFMGLSFAIPIEVAVDVAEQLKTQGKVTRGWLGVYIQEVTGELAESFGMPVPRGALVAQVITNSPAEKGGIQAGDVILSFNQQPVMKSSDLPPLVGLAPVGKPAAVALLRDGREQQLDFVIESLPDEQGSGSKRVREPLKPGSLERGNRPGVQFGMGISELDGPTRKALNIKQGVVVETLGPGPFSRAGVRTGDVIAMINGQPVESPRGLAKVVKQLPRGQSVPLLVYRTEGPVFMALKIPASQ